MLYMLGEILFHAIGVNLFILLSISFMLLDTFTPSPYKKIMNACSNPNKCHRKMKHHKK